MIAAMDGRSVMATGGAFAKVLRERGRFPS